MTTNKLKCPVCGERMTIYKRDNLLDIPLCSCNGSGCPLKLFPLNEVMQIFTLIQSRIDKEKTAAVKEERERAAIVVATCYANGIFDIDIIMDKIRDKTN